MVVIRHQVDDREGCRSLVCDANGIIVAEMVYRCMICTTVSDCIADAQKHYRSKHMDTIGHDDEPMVSYEDEDADESMVGDVHDLPESSDELGAADRATLTFSHPSGLKKLQSTAGDSDDEGPTTPLPAAGNGRGTRGGGGFQAAPDPAGDGSNTRGGYVTCAVCNITKFYASVQRRYGQFTCMGCAKFFGRFLLKPRKYCCPNLASCPLDVSPRCKACLLLACINTYTIDEKRMSVVDGHRPLKKTAVTASATSGNPSSLSGGRSSRPSPRQGPPLGSVTNGNRRQRH
ncbi:hypothetical protein HDE_03653 [Halotydeus destructor]|nr:hypothetical protein HDE_03653 [Halotydeus destructor]